MYVCMLSTCIYYSTLYFDSEGADCTRNGKVIYLLTHLKHRVFQFFSPILKALVVSITSTSGGTRHGTT